MVLHTQHGEKKGFTFFAASAFAIMGLLLFLISLFSGFFAETIEMEKISGQAGTAFIFGTVIFATAVHRDKEAWPWARIFLGAMLLVKGSYLLF